MERLIRNAYRLFSVSLYILILAFCFFLIWRKENYRKTIRNHWKTILVNSVIVLVIASIGFFIFFALEDSIYDYDYASNWTKSLTLAKMFYEEPNVLPSFLNASLKNDTYTYLSAFLSLPVILINNSFGFCCYGTFVFFVLPIFIVFQILYFTYFRKHKHLPILILISLVVFYVGIFNGESEVSGMLPLLMCYLLAIFPSFDEIDLIDNVSINLLAFLTIFNRRFYLYALVTFYICYFIKYLYYHKFRIFNRKGLLSFLKILFSGILLLAVVLIFYRDFFYRAIYTGYSEAYAYYDHGGKLIGFIYAISPVISFISLYGVFVFYKKTDMVKTAILVISVCLPALLFWRVQSFEIHHYYITLIGVIVFYCCGLYSIFESGSKAIKVALALFLLVQTSCVFLLGQNPKVFVGINRQPQVIENKEQYQDLINYLASVCGSGEDSKGVYFATGDKTINYDLIKNSILPNQNVPVFVYNSLDIRDGFPVNIKYVSYVVTSDPTLYFDKNYQHIYDIITYAIENVNEISSLYQLKKTCYIDNVEFKVYERTGAYTKEAMEYFYQEIMKYYPDKEDLFKNIISD